MARRVALPVSIGCSDAWLSPDNIGGRQGGDIHSEGVGMAWVLLVLAIVENSGVGHARLIIECPDLETEPD